VPPWAAQLAALLAAERAALAPLPSQHPHYREVVGDEQWTKRRKNQQKVGNLCWKNMRLSDGDKKKGNVRENFEKVEKSAG